MSSLPTNHVLEIEPGERVLSLDFTRLHPPNSLPSLPSPFFPPASHCFFVVIAGKSGAPHPPSVYYYFFFGPLFHSSGSLPPPRSRSLQVSGHAGERCPASCRLDCLLSHRGSGFSLGIGHHQKNGDTLCCSVTARRSARHPGGGLIPLNLIPPFTFPIPAAYNLPGRGRGLGLGWGESLPCAKMLTEVDTSPSGNCVG